MSHAGKSRSYTPDLRVTFRRDLRPCFLSQSLLIEVKPRRRLFKDLAEFMLKFRAARRYAEETGQDFTIITDREARGPLPEGGALFLLKFRALPLDRSARWRDGSNHTAVQNQRHQGVALLRRERNVFSRCACKTEFHFLEHHYWRG
jgi:hypothetical protein